MAPEIGTEAYKQLVSIDTAVEKLATEGTVGSGLKVNGAVTASGTVTAAQATAANLNCTEASAASILAATVGAQNGVGNGAAVVKQYATAAAAAAKAPADLGASGSKGMLIHVTEDTNIEVNGSGTTISATAAVVKGGSTLAILGTWTNIAYSRVTTDGKITFSGIA